MIRLTRVRTPEAIAESFRGARRRQLERELIERHRAQLPPRQTVWKAAKDQLRRESSGKCAYCEGKASHVAHGDVEHFRPKATYWWLAYCWDNYVYACQICNQSYKGENFPIAGTRWPEPQPPADLDLFTGSLAPDPLDAAAVRAFQATARAERALLPDPYALDPERFFAWRADDTLREVEVVPRPRARGARAAHGAAERFLGLNRQELRLWRYEIYEIATILADAMESPLIAADLKQRLEDKLRRMMTVDGEFAGMVRFYVRDVRGLAL
jgi:hypothetical protein